MFQAFIRDEKGAFAVVFAIMLIPFLALAGATVDYSQASNIRKQMQKATDASALAAGQEAVKIQDGDHLEFIAQQVFDANMLNTGFSGDVELNSGFSDDGYEVVATTNMNTTFLKLVNMDSIPIKASTEVSIGSGAGNIEVVMVYHISRSINLSKLKQGSKKIIDKLLGNENNGNIKVALVPFYKYVNIGAYNSGANWLNMNDIYNSPDPAVPTNWVGCVGIRDTPNDVSDSGYTGSGKVRRMSEHPAYCGQALTPLTSDKNTIKNAVDAMVANSVDWADYTHLLVGLKWGWSVLSPQAPFDQGAPYSDENLKVIIFVNDRVQNRHHITGDYGSWGQNETLANAETANVCANIKSAGIRIYSINVANNDADLSSTMSNCAGNGGNYKKIHASQLKNTLEDIGEELVNSSGYIGGDLRILR